MASVGAPSRCQRQIPVSRVHPTSGTTASAAPVPRRRLAVVARCRAVSAPNVPWPSGVPERPEADAVVIGSGLKGLYCAGLLARYDLEVQVVLQSRGPRPIPLAQVLDALG